MTSVKLVDSGGISVLWRHVIHLHHLLKREYAIPRADVGFIEGPAGIEVTAIVGDALGDVAIPVVPQLERVNHLREPSPGAKLACETLPKLVCHVVHRKAKDKGSSAFLVQATGPLQRSQIWQLERGQCAASPASWWSACEPHAYRKSGKSTPARTALWFSRKLLSNTAACAGTSTGFVGDPRIIRVCPVW